MKYAAALALAAAGTLVLAQPSHAQTTTRVIVAAPSVQRDGAELIVKSRVPGHPTSVRIQKRINGRWVTARWATVRNGAYGARVPASADTTTTLRAITTTTKSQTVTVAARRRPPSPSPSPTPTPTPTPTPSPSPTPTPSPSPSPTPTPSPSPTPTPSPTRAPTPTPGSDACGVQPLKADGTPWSCSFVDDFNGTSLDRTKWLPQTQFATGVQAAHACYLDDPSVIDESGGSLNLTVRRVATAVNCSFGGLTGPTNYVSGGVMTYHLFSQQYGRFEARIKNTATVYPGLHEAFWLWPDDRYTDTTLWPASGEMDVSETYSVYYNLAIPFLHYGYGMSPTPGLNTAWDCAAQRGVYNTYTLTWTPTRIEILVNGNTCLVNTSADPAFQKPYLVALTQAMGAAGNEFDGRAPIPATMNIDYVKVWQ